jgi:hypothetical protein
MHMLRVFATVSILVAPVVAIAQQPTRSDSMPHGGQWGAEAVVAPSTAGASVVRFHSPTFAWLLGAGLSANRSTTKADNPELGGTDFSTSAVSVSARLGVRWYRHSDNAKLRPVIGVGALGQFTRVQNITPTRMGGAYAELGAFYFVTPHMSLGGMIELDATRTRLIRATAAGFEIGTNTNTIAASLPRVMLSVYF